MGCYNKARTFPKLKNNDINCPTSIYSLKNPNVVKIAFIDQGHCSIYFSQHKHPEISEWKFIFLVFNSLLNSE